MGWLSRLLGGPGRSGAKPTQAPAARGASTAAAPPVGPGAAGAAVAPDGGGEEAQAEPPPGPPLLCWLLAGPAAPVPLPRPGPASADERGALTLLDEVLAQAALPAELLPRAANVVPQLLALLRQRDLPVPVLAERIGRDAVLAAEVLRQAGGAFFAHLGPVADLQQAIQRLGIEGLQMAIARVVLRPMFQAQPGSLSARTADRLWEHADVLSRHAVVAARAAGASAFDAYLVGLLHDSGWTVLMHVLQRAGIRDLDTPSEAGAEAFAQRAHALFGRAAAAWPITPAFTAFALDAQRTSLAQSEHALAAVLRAAQPPCMAELLGG